PRIYAKVKGSGDCLRPESATRSGHKTSPLPNTSASGQIADLTASTEPKSAFLRASRAFSSLGSASDTEASFFHVKMSVSYDGISKMYSYSPACTNAWNSARV